MPSFKIYPPEYSHFVVLGFRNKTFFTLDRNRYNTYTHIVPPSLNRHLIALSLAPKNRSAGILVDTNQLVDVASARPAYETRVPIPTTDISALRCRRKELCRSGRRRLCCHLTDAAPMASSDRTPSCSRGSAAAAAAAAAQKLEIERQRTPGLELLDGSHEIGEFFRKWCARRDSNAGPSA